MAKRNVPDLKELFKQASEIAQQVPENMQEAAFNRAIDLLAGVGVDSSTGSQTKKRKSQRESSPPANEGGEAGSPVGRLLAEIDSTRHPAVTSGLKVLDRSLMVLQIAFDDHGVDGLTPSEIAKILTDKFRVSTTSAAVSMALGKETSLVNRAPKGHGFSYRIMGPGKEHLSHLGEDSDQKTATGGKRTPRKRATTTTKRSGNRAPKERSEGSKGEKKASPTSKASSGGKVGPKAALLGLIDSGYFATARTGPETQEFLKKKRGLDLGTDQLRLAMLRLVRDGKLDRDDNAEGHYEYRQPSS